MIVRTLKKIFKKSDKKENEKPSTKLAATLREKSHKFSLFLGETFGKVHDEFFTIRGKLQNLRETNYNLGLRHLEKGNISDAIFRFRFMKKFWPDFFDAYYQLSYCLVLDRKLPQAKKNLEELLIKNPNHDKAKELLQDINNAMQQPSADA